MEVPLKLVLICCGLQHCSGEGSRLKKLCESLLFSNLFHKLFYVLLENKQNDKSGELIYGFYYF